MKNIGVKFLKMVIKTKNIDIFKYNQYIFIVYINTNNIFFFLLFIAKDFIRKLLVVNPAERMTCEQALQHRWLVTAANTSVLENVKKFNAKKTFKKGK